MYTHVYTHVYTQAELSTAVMAMLNEAPEIHLVVTDDAELALQAPVAAYLSHHNMPVITAY